MSILMMTGELRDEQFKPTGQWPEGSYSDLYWSRDRGVAGPDGKTTSHAELGRGLVMLESHVGLVLGTFERNGYSDSDFIAIVWNPEKGCIEQIEYATTRGWSYPNRATIDATPEVRAAALAWQQKRRDEERAEHLRLAAQAPEFGRWVVIDTVRGKVKAHHGQRGEICWTGPGFGRTRELRIGVRLTDGNKVFLPANGARAIVDDKPAEKTLQQALNSLGILRTVSAYSALPTF
jgi:hypothetical protein